MSMIAPTLEAFFSDRLLRQRSASPRTVVAYRECFRLLLEFVDRRSGKAPSRVEFQDLDATVIGAFLDHLEKGRGNSVRTRNARLAAIHSFFRLAAYRHPEHAALIQRVLAVPYKRSDQRLVTFMTAAEVDAILAAPDLSTWFGRRDQALLLLTVQTGLRLSKLTALRIRDVHLDSGPFVRCSGKGRKERVTPLTSQTVKVLRAWIRERAAGPDDLLFPSRDGGRMSADAVQDLVHKHAVKAAQTATSLAAKNVTPHVLRHTAAMQLLKADVDLSTIALWLGHEQLQTTQIYIHAELSIKERALSRTTPPGARPGRYRPSDRLMKYLADLPV